MIIHNKARTTKLIKKLVLFYQINKHNNLNNTKQLKNKNIIKIEKILKKSPNTKLINNKITKQKQYTTEISHAQYET